jgi:hypothetical protein
MTDYTDSNIQQKIKQINWQKSIGQSDRQSVGWADEEAMTLTSDNDVNSEDDCDSGAAATGECTARWVVVAALLLLLLPLNVVRLGRLWLILHDPAVDLTVEQVTWPGPAAIAAAEGDVVGDE